MRLLLDEVRLAPTTRASGREPVTRERIAEAALRILDGAEDRSALTMRSLGEALGVKAPSLYAHISGIDEVLALVHARINASIDLRPLSLEDPLDGLGQFAHLYRQAYRRHPVAAMIIIAGTVINEDHALQVYEPVAACLSRAGVPSRSVMPVMAVLDNLCLGSAVEPFAEGFTDAPAAYRPRYPHLATALAAARRRHIDDEGFEIGLSAFLDIVRRLGSS